MVTTSCPGSINLMGEHALIRGGKGIRIAVDRLVHVSLERRSDSLIHIQSRLGHFSGDIQRLRDVTIFSFLSNALDYFDWPTGLDIRIKDDLPSDVGLGSSAALTVALIKGLNELLNPDQTRTQQNLFSQVKNVIKSSQGGIGSGIDAAASIYGGMVYYCTQKEIIETLPLPPEISVLTSGVKVPTIEAVRFVNDQNPQDEIFEKMNKLTTKGANDATANDWERFGQRMLEYQELMTALKLNTPELDRLQKLLMDTKGVYGAKIAGAGLGDSVIAIGAKGHRIGLQNHPAYIKANIYVAQTGREAG